MTMNRFWLLLALLAMVLVAAPGCDSGGGDDDTGGDTDSDSDGDSDGDSDSDSDSDSDTGTETDTGTSAVPPTLDSSHTGWQQADCFTSGCHTDGHNGATMPYQCVACHGKNGAPQGHDAGCGNTSCHAGKNHGGDAKGFPAPKACQACHVN